MYIEYRVSSQQDYCSFLAGRILWKTYENMSNTQAVSMLCIDFPATHPQIATPAGTDKS